MSVVRLLRARAKPKEAPITAPSQTALRRRFAAMHTLLGWGVKTASGAAGERSLPQRVATGQN